MLKKIKKMISPKNTKKEKCSVCAKQFTHQAPDTLVGMLGIIPVQFCKKCFPRVMAQSEELNLKDTRLKVV
jgi:hypothetical protein